MSDTADDSAFCDAWLTLGSMPSVNEPARAEAWAGDAQHLFEVTPPRHKPAVEQMNRTAADFLALGEQAGWSTEGFEQLSEGQQMEMAQAADQLGRFFVGPVAAYAHQTCPGVDDPAFQLSCVGHRSFLSTARSDVPPDQQGGAAGPGGTVAGAAVADPVGTAQALLPAVPGATEVRHREVDGMLQITFLDEHGRSLELFEHAPAADGWAAPTVHRCT